MRALLSSPRIRLRLALAQAAIEGSTSTINTGILFRTYKEKCRYVHGSIFANMVAYLQK